MRIAVASLLISILSLNAYAKNLKASVGMRLKSEELQLQLAYDLLRQNPYGPAVALGLAGSSKETVQFFINEAEQNFQSLIRLKIELIDQQIYVNNKKSSLFVYSDSTGIHARMRTKEWSYRRDLTPEDNYRSFISTFTSVKSARHRFFADVLPEAHADAIDDFSPAGSWGSAGIAALAGVGIGASVGAASAGVTSLVLGPSGLGFYVMAALVSGVGVGFWNGKTELNRTRLEAFKGFICSERGQAELGPGGKFKMSCQSSGRFDPRGKATYPVVALKFSTGSRMAGIKISRHDTEGMSNAEFPFAAESIPAGHILGHISAEEFNKFVDELGNCANEKDLNERVSRSMQALIKTAGDCPGSSSGGGPHSPEGSPSKGLPVER